MKEWIARLEEISGYVMNGQYPDGFNKSQKYTLKRASKHFFKSGTSTFGIQFRA